MPGVPQITLKKQHGSLTNPDSYTVRPCAVTTTFEKPRLLWLNEIKDLDKTMLAEGKELGALHSMPEYASPSAIVEYVRKQISNGSVPKEHVGRHGKPGLAFPGLDQYDDVHQEVIGACSTSPLPV